MDITIKIDDELFAQPVKDAISRQINQVISIRVSQRINELSDGINKAIDEYIRKNYPEDKLKSMMNDEILSVLRERLERLDD